VIYGQRDELLEADSVKANIDGIRSDVVADLVERFVPPNSVDDQWDLPGLEPSWPPSSRCNCRWCACTRSRTSWTRRRSLAKVQESVEAVPRQGSPVGGETMRMLEKHVMLNVLDQNWKEHLGRMDYLRQGIHLRGYAQKQPKQEYKKEAFELFSELLEKVKREVMSLLARVRIRSEAEVAAAEAEERARAEAVAGRCSSSIRTWAGWVPTRKPRPCSSSASSRRATARPSTASAATIPAPAAAARSSSTATGSLRSKLPVIQPACGLDPQGRCATSGPTGRASEPPRLRRAPLTKGGVGIRENGGRRELSSLDSLRPLFATR
jgi:hypothetical protein